MLLQEDGLPPHVKDDLGRGKPWSESEILEYVSMFWIFRSCGEEWKFGLFYKIHQNAFVQDQAADRKGRALTQLRGILWSFSHLSMRMESKNPNPGPQPCTHLPRILRVGAVTHGCSVLASSQGLFLVVQRGELIYCCLKCMCCRSSLGKKFTILLLDNSQVFLFFSFSSWEVLLICLLTVESVYL